MADQKNVEGGNCADCLFSVTDGDLGFVCANRKSECWGTYSSGCELYEEDNR